MDRRELIQWMAATAAFGRTVHRTPAKRRPIATRSQQTIALAAERILPGAAEGNVGPFIEKMLADWYTADESAPVLAGLQALEQRNFLDASEADQVALLTALDTEAAGHSDHWFTTFKYLTTYGWCTSEPGMRARGLWPLPWRYDPCAPV
jgi:hypothetical protein